jgi:hypothetical protein
VNREGGVGSSRAVSFVTGIADLGSCRHRVSAQLTDQTWSVALDPQPCQSADAVLDALGGASGTCQSIPRMFATLVAAGIGPSAAIGWCVTGVVDPHLQRRIEYRCPPGRHWKSWINAGANQRGRAPGASTHPWLAIEEIADWWEHGWPPAEAAASFRAGHRRPARRYPPPPL